MKQRREQRPLADVSEVPDLGPISLDFRVLPSPTTAHRTKAIWFVQCHFYCHFRDFEAPLPLPAFLAKRVPLPAFLAKRVPKRQKVILRGGFERVASPSRFSGRFK